MTYKTLPGSSSLNYASSTITVLKSRNPKKTNLHFSYRSEAEAWFSVIDPQDYIPMREWCMQTLKHGDWGIGPYYIVLKNEKDLTLFLLRWS